MAGNTKADAFLFVVSSAQAAAAAFMDRRENRQRRCGWTEKELQIIREYYVDKGSQFCKWHLPKRSIHSIRHKARELGKLRELKIKWQRPELDVVIRGVSRNKCTKEILDDLATAGYERSYIAVRDCRLAMISRYGNP